MSKSVSTLISIITLAGLSLILCRPAAQAQGANRTALIVVHGDGYMTSKCIHFDEAEISSHDVLQRSGLSVRFSGYGSFGAAVCAIDREGCPREDQQCFCQCLGTPCLFWSFWLWRDGQWAFSQRGASNVPVHDGDLQAWFWADGQTPPPAVPFEQICPAPPTHTPLPTNTPVPTETPRPTDKPLPKDTPVPTQAPTDTSAPTAAPANTAVPTKLPTDTPALALEATATVAPTDTPAFTMTPAGRTSFTPATVTQRASPTTEPTLPQTAAPTATATSTASPISAPTLTATPLPLPTAAPPPPSPGTAPLAQYGAFALLAAVLLGGFWMLRQRQGAR